MMTRLRSTRTWSVGRRSLAQTVGGACKESTCEKEGGKEEEAKRKKRPDKRATRQKKSLTNRTPRVSAAKPPGSCLQGNSERSTQRFCCVSEGEMFLNLTPTFSQQVRYPKMARETLSGTTAPN